MSGHAEGSCVRYCSIETSVNLGDISCFYVSSAAPKVIACGHQNFKAMLTIGTLLGCEMCTGWCFITTVREDSMVLQSHIMIMVNQPLAVMVMSSEFLFLLGSGLTRTNQIQYSTESSPRLWMKVCERRTQFDP